jgi:formate hydrogenlyase transcriptional activator
MAEDSPGPGRGDDTELLWCGHVPGRGSPESSRYRLLLEATDILTHSRGPHDLFKELAPRIFNLTGCNFLNFSMYDEHHDCMVTHYWKGNRETGELDAFAVDECLAGWVWKSQEVVTLPDIQKETRFQACIPVLREHGVRSYCMLPMSTNGTHHGVLGIGRDETQIPGMEDLEFLSCIARVAALVLQGQKAREALQERDQRLQSLVAISHQLSSSLELDTLLPKVFAELRQITSCDYAVVALPQDDNQYVSPYAADWVSGPESLQQACRRVLSAEATAEEAIKTRVTTHWSAEDLDGMATPVAKELRAAGIRSVCNVPLVYGGEVLGALNLGSRRDHAFRPEDAQYLQHVANQTAAALRNASVDREMKQRRDRLTQEKRYLESELKEATREGDIIGSSPLLKRALDQASVVADTDSTVLITGETGTGKELIARIIHSMSTRKDRSFIKLNCAAIPTGLLESELFGHEKGAFTGAISQKVGRLELADKGTLLLDEVGDIPLELQPKLLRVLQDQEFERLGSTRTIRVDVRMIAATNRDLLRAVEEKEFRDDLYYRLHVFPLHLPPLRERREDIPLLVHHFVEKYSARLRHRIDIIPDEAIEAMLKWTWPGNIRELENFIERSVILSDGNTLRPPLSELRWKVARQETGSGTTLRDKERDHIIETLRQTHGVLSGRAGAAVRLGLKRTTLQYKIQKLGISRIEYLD